MQYSLNDQKLINILQKKWLGLVSYHEALEEQNRAWTIANTSGQGVVLGLEHKPVITLGRRLQTLSEALIVNSERVMAKESAYSFSELNGFEIVNSDRGGEATMHTPGQLVMYPVLPIRDWAIGVREFVYTLEQVLIDVLANYEIESFRIEGRPGVYTDKGKIAFIGIRVRDGITQHGLSLNVRNDLNLFRLIRPCGMNQQEMDSVSFYNDNATPKLMYEALAAELVKAFSLTKTPNLSESATNHLRP